MGFRRVFAINVVFLFSFYNFCCRFEKLIYFCTVTDLVNGTCRNWSTSLQFNEKISASMCPNFGLLGWNISLMYGQRISEVGI